MKENVIIVNCNVPSEAYQILSVLRQDSGDEGFAISRLPLLRRTPDSFPWRTALSTATR